MLVAASAGGIGALQRVLKALPADLPAAVIVVQHRTPSQDDGLPRVLARWSSLPVRLASEGDPIEPGVVYLARSDNHLTLRPDGPTRVRRRHQDDRVLPLDEIAPAIVNRVTGATLLGALDRA